MKIVADERIAALGETFARHGELLALPGREISPAHLENADALITRTVTRVDRELLEGTGVKFVGTATIGTDHLDTRYLDAHAIGWASAPGCNADATAQYTLAMFLLACRRLGLDPLAQTYGIVGCGNVGGRLRNLLEALDMHVIACDPPLQDQGTSGFHSMDDILECDAISLHVPLTRTGRWPTHHMFDQATFDRLGTGHLLINACRGDVIDEAPLRRWIESGGHAALDVWPGEPDIAADLVQLATVASPHIAGYSLDGKLRATSMVYRAFCAHFGLEHRGDAHPPAGPRLDTGSLAAQGFDDIVLATCPVERDDRVMRERLGHEAADRTAEFDALRSNYPGRRDFSAWALEGGLDSRLASILKKMGFSITNR